MKADPTTSLRSSVKRDIVDAPLTRKDCFCTRVRIRSQGGRADDQPLISTVRVRKRFQSGIGQDTRDDPMHLLRERSLSAERLLLVVGSLIFTDALTRVNDGQLMVTLIIVVPTEWS